MPDFVLFNNADGNYEVSLVINFIGKTLNASKFFKAMDHSRSKMKYLDNVFSLCFCTNNRMTGRIYAMVTF